MSGAMIARKKQVDNTASVNWGKGLEMYLAELESDGAPVDWADLDKMLDAEYMRRHSVENDHDWIRHGC